MKQYIFLCGSFILVLTTVLIIFVVSTATNLASSDDDPDMESGNMVFIALCIALLVILIAVSVVCLITCNHIEQDEKNSDSQNEGAYYKLTWNPILLKQSGTDCPICWEDMKASMPAAELSCNHAFHPGCVEQHFSKNSKTCPLCRAIPIMFPGARRMKFSIVQCFEPLLSRLTCSVPTTASPTEWV